MSEPQDDRVPWDDLPETKKVQFMHMVEEFGLEVEDREEVEKYYGNRHRLEADILRKSRMPEYDPAHDEYYGYIQADPPTELYGVGEFHPDAVGAGTPVFEAKTEAGSFLTFCLPPDEVGDEWLRVFHANSYEEGEFSALMNRVLQHFQGEDPEPKRVVFTAVVSEWLEGADLREKLHGFEERVVEVPESGEKIPELVGEWDPTG